VQHVFEITSHFSLGAVRCVSGAKLSAVRETLRLEPIYAQQDDAQRLKLVEQAVKRCLVGERAAQDGDGLLPVKGKAQVKAPKHASVALIQMPLDLNFVPRWLKSCHGRIL
jgi:hypothetical protein